MAEKCQQQKSNPCLRAIEPFAGMAYSLNQYVTSHRRTTIAKRGFWQMSELAIKLLAPIGEFRMRVKATKKDAVGNVCLYII